MKHAEPLLGGPGRKRKRWSRARLLPESLARWKCAGLEELVRLSRPGFPVCCSSSSCAARSCGMRDHRRLRGGGSGEATRKGQRALEEGCSASALVLAPSFIFNRPRTRSPAALSSQESSSVCSLLNLVILTVSCYEYFFIFFVVGRKGMKIGAEDSGSIFRRTLKIHLRSKLIRSPPHTVRVIAQVGLRRVKPLKF